MKTDTQLMSDVQAELDWDSSVDNRDIVIAVKDGIVTLAGHVGSFVDKWSAEKCVKGVAGVRAVANEIEVKIGATGQRSDREIAQAAVSMLKSNVSVPASDIKVIVDDGRLTLEGNVSLWHQKNAAENAVRNLWGVKGIVNNIDIKAKVYPGDVKGRIRQSFKRHANLDADKVQVAVADSTVTLAGEVSSWHEREDAELAAWSAPGVARVQNTLSVRP